MGCQKTMEFGEEMVRGLVKTLGTRGFFLAMHNAFSHGEAMEAAGESFDDEQLGQLFEHFEGLNAVAKNIE